MRFIVLLVIFSIGLVGCSGIGRRLTLPGPYLKPPAAVLREASDFELVRIASPDGSVITLQFAPAQTAQGDAINDSLGHSSVVFCYGNGMSIFASQPVVTEMRRSGINVVVADYPGYAMSTGARTEEGCYMSAVVAFDYLVSQKKIPTHKIGVVGLSLGASVATELTLRRPTSALALVVPFTCTQDVGRDNLAWYLRWVAPALTKAVPFDNVRKLDKVRIPILLVEASHDQLTSATRTQELKRAARAPIDIIQVDSDHDGAWTAAGPQIKSWLSRILSVPGQGAGPNQALEPTPTAVTDPADAGSAPASGVAHL